MSAPEHMLKTHTTANRMSCTVLCIGFDSIGCDCGDGESGGFGEAVGGEGDRLWVDIVCCEVHMSCSRLQWSV
jgi:hypothetical protein